MVPNPWSPQSKGGRGNLPKLQWEWRVVSKSGDASSTQLPGEQAGLLTGRGVLVARAACLPTCRRSAALSFLQAAHATAACHLSMCVLLTELEVGSHISICVR